MPFLSTSFESQDKDALLSLLHLAVNLPTVLTLIAQQPCFLDGLDDQEAKFVIVVGTPKGRFFGPESFTKLIVKHQVESRIATMPLSGEVRLTYIQSSLDPGTGELVAQVEDAMRTMESFMGVPFPRQEVILLLAAPLELNKPLDFELTGINRGTHILVNSELGRQGDTNRIITHELAGYYWGPQEAPRWFQEGGASFLASYVRNTLYGESLEDRSIYTLSRAVSVCKSTGLQSIQGLIDRLAVDGLTKHQASPYFTCNDNQGENLFLDLYNTLGSESFRSSWKELYELAKREGRAVNETQIYRAFLRHTTTDTVDEFNDLYGRLHGGVFEG
jgi:hypothetical protein